MRTFLAAVMTIAWGTGTPSPEPARPAMTKIVGRVQRADYEGDRKALASLAGELAPYTQESVLASRALYWRGFALWRRAFNGFNDNVEPRELEKDLTDAVSDFADAAAKDPAFVDARIGSASCLFTLAFLMKSDAERSRAYVTQGVQQMNEVKKVARENPRFLWVQGGGEFILPPERGGGQGKAIETYERALATARKLKGGVQDPLEPSWGEPELLMSLAWSHLNRATPDLQAAESNAREALSLVPYWHYMRDILLPQIREKARLAAQAPPPPAGPADFDFLEGKWTIVYNNTQPGIPPDIRGTWTASRQADGRVLYDEFRLLGPAGETVFLGTTYRAFDHIRQEWDMRYVGLVIPGPEGAARHVAQWAELTAWREGPTMRVDQQGQRASLRITYYDIARDHFSWKADVSVDGGKTWQKDQIRIEARRAPAS